MRLLSAAQLYSWDIGVSMRIRLTRSETAGTTLVIEGTSTLRVISFYAGRMPEKQLIKTGGENVYPAEVESVIRKHPAISDVVVIGVPDPQWGEAVKAICVLHPSMAATPEEIVAFAGELIARYKRPKIVTFIDSLPRNSAGEIDRASVTSTHAHTKI